jgi:outer membrane protein assembly factor BamD
MNRKSSIPFVVIVASLLCLFIWDCGPKAPQVILDAEDQYAVAKREYEKERWNEAVVELQKLIFNYPGVAFIDSAQYLLGMAYFNQKEYFSAIQEFNKILYSYPTSTFSDDAAFMITNCDFEMSPKAELDPTHTQKALDGIERFLENYPQSERKQEAEELLIKCKDKLAKKAYQAGELYFKRGKYSAALIYLGYVLNDYHDTECVKKSLFLQAEVFFKQGEYGKAKEGFQKFLQDYPDDKLTKKAEKRLKKIEEKKKEG